MLWLLLSACGPADKDAHLPDENAPPEAAIVSITPAGPSTDDTLQAVIQGGGSDPDGDAVSFAYAWYVDGADAGLSGDAVDPSATTKGETWRVVVTPNDGTLDGEAAFAEVVVLDSPPPPRSR